MEENTTGLVNKEQPSGGNRAAFEQLLENAIAGIKKKS